jgi:hypothetical protein
MSVSPFSIAHPTPPVRFPPIRWPAVPGTSLPGRREADPLYGQCGQEEDKMGHSEFDPAFRERRPWNAGRMVGAKRALKPQQVWAIRFWLDRERRLRDRALFDLGIDSKLRGCDVVKIRVGELVSGGRVRTRATVTQQKTGRPVQSSCLKRLAPAYRLGWNTGMGRSKTTPSRAAPTMRTTSALGSMPDLWTSGLQPSVCGARIMARTRSGGRRHRSSTRPPATACGAAPIGSNQDREHGTLPRGGR